MKIRIHQLNPIVGDLSGNTRKVMEAYRAASKAGMDLLILQELIVCGYPPLDLLERSAFLKALYKANETLVSATGSTGLLFGSVLPNTSGTGRKIVNAAILAVNGSITQVTHKTLLPTYDIFDEYRYFEPAQKTTLTEFDGVRFGVTICEDIWNNQNEIVYHVYDKNPAADLKALGADVLVNISGSPFTKPKQELRLNMLRNHARALELPILYCNQVGANTEVVFDGDSMAIDRDGRVCASAGMFEEAFIDVEYHPKSKVLLPLRGSVVREAPLEERLFKALRLGIRDYVDKTNFPRNVLLGLSGGVDSALVAVLAREALGSDAVTGVLMPSPFSSEGSITDSVTLAKNLGISTKKIPITPMYQSFLETLKPEFTGIDFGVTEENIQSRIRGVLLMALSNKFGYLLLSTGNKSEMAVGYCTLYGDMAGGLSVISDLYKTEVYALCRWLNDVHYRAEVIPEAILTKEPSAELRPGQKDADSLPDYQVLDRILIQYIEEQKPSAEIIKSGIPADTVNRVITMVDRNEYKRRQSAPGLRVSPKAFGSGRRMPIVQQWTGHEQE